MKTKTNINIDEVHFGTHFEQQLGERFSMSVNDVKQQIQYFKRGNINSPFSQVRNKIANYAHQVVFYNQRHNLMFTVDTTNNVACTAMYLEPNK